jgi:hypothetical protein
MDTAKILADLRSERERIDRAIAALEGLGPAAPVVAVRVSAKPAGGRRRMSAAGRKRIAEAARRMWAERKRKAAADSAKPAKKPARRVMSAAVRKRLSILAKQRWAARKAAGA